MSSRKRKHSTSSELDPTSTSDVDFQESPYTSSAKKRRYDLARNLSQLSLFEQVNEPAQAEISPVIQSTPLPYAVGGNDSPVPTWSRQSPMNPSIDADGDESGIDAMHAMIEEPAESFHYIPEVRMHNTSSYEPEKDRIIITDLDSSEDEAEPPPDVPAAGDDAYTVSPAFLSRIKASGFTPLMKSPSLPNKSDPTRALVLFKPSPWIAKTSHELERIYHTRDMEKDTRELVVTEVASTDPDAMEIE